MTEPSQLSKSGFALGIFNRGTHNLRNFEAAHRRDSFVASPTELFDLGCVLEQRLLLAHGALTGVFPIDSVRAWLQRDDELLQRVDFDNFGENSSRLPQYMDADQLLSETPDPESQRQDVERALLFRQFENRPSIDRQYQQLQCDVLFSAEDRWNRRIENTAHVLGTISPNDLEYVLRLSYLQARWSDDREEYAQSLYTALESPQSGGAVAYAGLLNATYDWVLVCSHLLESINGTAMNSSDPWGLAPDRNRYAYSYPVLAKWLQKVDPRSSERIAEAVKFVRAVDFMDDERRRVHATTVRGAFLLRLFQYARMPAELFMDSYQQEARLDALRTMPVYYDTSVIRALGPSWSWAACLWRTAPPDERSVLRMRQLVSLVSRSLDAVTDNQGHWRDG